MPYAAQAKLLEFLDSKEYYQRGGTRPLRADVRIVAATNVDLESAIRRSAFREDLLFRLNVMPIQVPSLAERRKTSPISCGTSAAAPWKGSSCDPSSHPRARSVPRRPPNGPGTFASSRTSSSARPSSPRARLASSASSRRHLFPDDGASTESTRGATFQDATRDFQANLVRRTLGEVEWNVSEAALAAPLTRSHVYNLIKAFGLERRRD